jgi:hypothetical protein
MPGFYLTVSIRVQIFVCGLFVIPNIDFLIFLTQKRGFLIYFLSNQTYCMNEESEYRIVVKIQTTYVKDFWISD